MADVAVLEHKGIAPGVAVTLGFEAHPQAAANARATELRIIDSMHGLKTDVLAQVSPWQRKWKAADSAVAKIELLNSARNRGLARGATAWTHDQVGFVEGVWGWFGDEAEAAWDWYSDLPLLGKIMPGAALGVEAGAAIADEAGDIWDNREHIMALVKALAAGSVDAVQQAIELLSQAAGEIGEVMKALWDKGHEWVHALIEVCRESRALDVIFATIGGLLCGIPPNLWVEGGSMVGGYVLPEVLLDVVLTIIAALTAGAGAVALSARMGMIAAKVVETCKKMGRLGKVFHAIYDGIKKLGGDIITLVKWLYKKVAEKADGALDRVKTIVRRSERVAAEEKHNLAEVHKIRLAGMADAEMGVPVSRNIISKDGLTRTPEGRLTTGGKKVIPDSLVQSKAILGARREEIAQHGYQAKYTDAQLGKLAESGEVANERYQVRFMETQYLTNRETPAAHLSGAMGQTLTTTTGRGAKYWATSFDQLEDKDTDPRLIAKSLGLKYNPDADYSLVIVDTQKAMPLTGAKSVPGTFEHLGRFGHTELPDEFPRSLTDRVMTPEFQAEYSQHYLAAEKAGAFEDGWSPSQFRKHLTASGMKGNKVKLLTKRMRMHKKLGNNEFYTGDGLTQNLIEGSSNRHGVVETFNFERKEVNLAELSNADAITIISSLRPIP